MKHAPNIAFDGLPLRHFGAIVADPPWNWKSYRDDIGSRSAARHYSVMQLSEIKIWPVASLTAPTGCHLFLWTTGPHLQQAFEVINAWGFKYSSVAFTWLKLKRRFEKPQLRFVSDLTHDFHFGLGKTTRKNMEFCLLARRGNARRLATDVRELIIAPVREHSRKPDEAMERIERYSVGPYLELFARTERPGWTSWGNEREKFNA